MAKSKRTLEAASIHSDVWRKGRNCYSGVACNACKTRIGSEEKVRRVDIEFNCMRGDDVVVFICTKCDREFTIEELFELSRA